MRTVSTPDGNLTQAFLEDHPYTVVFDKSLNMGRIMMEEAGDEFIFAFTNRITNIEQAVSWAHEHFNTMMRKQA